MFAISDQTGMVSKRAHVHQVLFHVVIIGEEQIPEQTVYGEHSRNSLEIIFDRLYGVTHNLSVVAKFQKNQYIGVVYLPETRQRIAADLFNGDDACVVSVDFSEWILESLGGNLLLRHMENILVDLFGGFPI